MGNLITLRRTKGTSDGRLGIVDCKLEIANLFSGFRCWSVSPARGGVFACLLWSACEFHCCGRRVFFVVPPTHPGVCSASVERAPHGPRFGRSVSVLSPLQFCRSLHLAEVYITNFSNDIFMER